MKDEIEHLGSGGVTSVLMFDFPIVKITLFFEGGVSQGLRYIWRSNQIQ